jgi:hypothetical protein
MESAEEMIEAPSPSSHQPAPPAAGSTDSESEASADDYNAN